MTEPQLAAPATSPGPAQDDHPAMAGRPGSPDAASRWVTRFASLIPMRGRVLDVAAGGGRHSRWLAARGWSVVAVERDTSALLEVAARDGCNGCGDIEVVEADLEEGDWPFPGRWFDGIVVTNYLHRPLLPTLLGSIAPGGALLYETYAAGHERYGRPTNPDWLLRPGELLDAVRGELTVVAYEDLTTDKPARVQRIAAVREE